MADFEPKNFFEKILRSGNSKFESGFRHHHSEQIVRETNEYVNSKNRSLTTRLV